MGTVQSRTTHARSRVRPSQRRDTPPQSRATDRPRIPEIRFRVLVIGRANAGKTSILQRVCETTESPTIYRGYEEVRSPSFCLQV
jgi:GTPase SAR1 family protein